MLAQTTQKVVVQAVAKVGNVHLRSLEPTLQDKGVQKESIFHKFQTLFLHIPVTPHDPHENTVTLHSS